MKKIHKKILNGIIKIVICNICCITCLTIFDTTIVEASTVVQNGAFKLTAENKWDIAAKKNYAQLNWDAVAELDRDGYKIYQKKGNSWEEQSAKFNQQIKVLNLYPDIPKSNLLKEWMDGLGLKSDKGTNLIEVTPMSISEFEKHPVATLMTAGNYNYDVVMCGTWDWNGHMDLKPNGTKALEDFAQSGRGILFGHDTITNNNPAAGKPRHVNFCKFAPLMGIKLENGRILGSAKVKVVNNGYLMKYPFVLKDNLIMDIPIAHTYGQMFPKKQGTIWLTFQTPYTHGPLTEDVNYTNEAYLYTNGNLGMIQTGHSSGKSTPDEQKIIANTLYNLAKVSMDNHGQAHSVKDEVSPYQLGATHAGGTIANFSVNLNSVDRGTDHEWYVTASTKNKGVIKSDVVKETILSNVGGYLYVIDNNPTTVPKENRDEFGKITNLNINVNPEVSTIGKITGINGVTDADKYIHYRSADRVHNISTTEHVQIKQLMKEFRITEKFIGDDNKEIFPNSFQDIKRNQQYSKTAPDGGDYEPYAFTIKGKAKANGTTAKINTVADNYEITYHYRKKSVQLLIKYVDEEGKPLELTDGQTVADKPYNTYKVGDNYDLTVDNKKLPELYQQKDSVYGPHGYYLVKNAKNLKDKVQLGKNGQFEVTVVFSGGLVMDVPPRITFEEGRVTPESQVLPRKNANTDDWKFKVYDRRPENGGTKEKQRGEWQVVVHVSQQLTNSTSVLQDMIHYEDSVEDKQIGSSVEGAVKVHEVKQVGTLAPKVTEVKMPKNKGMKLVVPNSTSLKTGQYNGKLQWTLQNTP